jgi:3-hydroxyacyl-CoA dehydrogenase/enoyl-CoA hydratase/3-hydroxybutyryl-CoA epimerase
MIEIGRPSRLKGAGFYEYVDGKRTQLWPGLRETFKSGTSQPPLQDMIDRMLFAEALETQKCLDEGVLTSTADANIGSIMGIGFPAWTGGSAQYIVGYQGPGGTGKEAFVARAKELGGQVRRPLQSARLADELTARRKTPETTAFRGSSCASAAMIAW